MKAQMFPKVFILKKSGNKAGRNRMNMNIFCHMVLSGKSEVIIPVQKLSTCDFVTEVFLSGW